MSATQSRSGPAGEEAAVDEVLADPDAGHADRGPPAAAPDYAGDAGLAHQALHALAPDPDAVAQPQFGVNPRRAVDPPIRQVDLASALSQPFVLERSRRRRAVAPVRESPT